jgi:hypothetical protein
MPIEGATACCSCNCTAFGILNALASAYVLPGILLLTRCPGVSIML